MSFFKSLTSQKTLAQLRADHEDPSRTQLKRALGPVQLVALGIGCIIGAGIFVMTGSAAANYAGPALVLSFILGAIVCALAGLCYAELASVIPVSGSAYTYAYFSLGELLAWIVGSCLILEYGLAAATVAVGWSGYLVSFLKDFGIVIPEIWSQPWGHIITFPNGTTTEAIFNVPAFLSTLVVTLVLVYGVKESATVNALIVVLKILVIVTFIAVGIFYVNTDNWVPFIPENQGGSKYGWPGILTGASVIFFAYVGFDAVATAAQEAKNPQRDMPIGILGSLFICTILYMLVAGVLTGIVPYPQLNVPDPIAVAVNSIGMPWLASFVKIGALLGLFSVMLVCVYAQVRITYVIAKDGLLPSVLGQLHPTRHTPHLNTFICGLLIATAAGLTPIHTLGHMVSMGTLLAFVVVCAGVLYLRYKHPEIQRPFRCPGVPYVPVGGIAACSYLIYGLPSETFHNFSLWLVGALVIYLLYGQRHSKLRK